MHIQKGVVLACLAVLILLLNNCMNGDQVIKEDPRSEEYAGSAGCRSCHLAIYASYIKTAHKLTSAPASKQAIKGSFAADSNVLFYRPSLKVEMKQTDSGFYQVAYLEDVQKQSARFDIVIGSGRKGQTYLSWMDDRLFQLPVSYYVPENKWINSPSYPPGFVLFNRNISIGCFECHSAFIKKTATQPAGNYMVDHFDKNQLVYGIDCERCHGPAASHVNFHQKNPDAKKPMFMAHIAGLARQQKLDMCAVCHAGTGETGKSGFYYKPGDSLSGYLHPDASALDVHDIDVHGKQYQLLLASKCFLKSTDLTCSSCHNTHGEEHGNMKVFSMRCMNCHANPKHSSFTTTASTQAHTLDNCIDCHMPAKPSAVIVMQSQTLKDPVPALVRTHYISIYADATRKFLLKEK